jgi:hypothetical protein
VQNLEKVPGRTHSPENLQINNKVNLMMSCLFGRTLDMISHYCLTANALGNKQREDNGQDHAKDKIVKGATKCPPQRTTIAMLCP